MYKQPALLLLPLRAHANICDKFGSNAMCSESTSPKPASSRVRHMLSLRVDNGAKARTLDHQNPIDGPKQRPEMTTEEADGGDEAFPASIFACRIEIPSRVN
jgi:hypothetical protein